MSAGDVAEVLAAAVKSVYARHDVGMPLNHVNRVEWVDACATALAPLIAARERAAVEGVVARVGALAAEVEPDAAHEDHGGGNGENVLRCARCWRDGIYAALAAKDATTR